MFWVIINVINDYDVCDLNSFEEVYVLRVLIMF